MRHPRAIGSVGRSVRAVRPLSAVLAAAVLFAACVDGNPAGVSTPAFLSLSAELDASGSLAAGPISRIRVTVTTQASSEVVSREVFQVSPDASSWEIAVEVDIAAAAGSPVLLAVELISVVGGVETVEWSGRIGPIDLRGGSGDVHPVTVYPGPLENLDVTAVSIRDPSSATLVEGETLALQVDVASPSGGAQAVWLALDPAVATVSPEGLVTTHRSGSARIVAAAGPRADTLALSVRQRLAAVDLSPDSLLARAVGDTAVFQASGLDPRGDPIAGVSLAWDVADPTIARHVGGGRFETLRHGSTTVSVTASAAAASSPDGTAAQNLTATAKLVVLQGIFALTVSPEELSIRALNRIATLTADARREDGSPFEDPELSWRSTDTDVATVDGTGRVRSVAEGSAEIIVSADGLEAAATVTVTDEGGGGSELIVTADVDLFSTAGGGAAGNQQLARNLAANGDRPYVIWYIGNGSYFTSETAARSYWAPLVSVIESQLGLTLMVVGDNELGLLAGIPPEDVASVWVPMPHSHFTESQLDQVEGYLATGGRVVLFAEHSGFEQVNTVVQSALFRLGSDATVTGACLLGTALPVPDDPLTTDIEGVGLNCSSWFTLGEADGPLFTSEAQVVIFRAGLGGRRLGALRSPEVVAPDPAKRTTVSVGPPPH